MFPVNTGLRLEVQEVDKKGNVFICPALHLDPYPWHGARKIIKYAVNTRYEIIPEVENDEMS